MFATRRTCSSSRRKCTGRTTWTPRRCSITGRIFGSFPARPTEGDAAKMAPYYMIMRLPGEQQAETILMLPMVPSQRENMIAWLAARCDPPHYGEVVVYEFPKDKLVYGPFQIEARINQNTAISQQLSLWNQLGSRVIRGNLHVIPIENSILYVSPLYLRAATGQIPELKRVIAAYGDQVVMEETLAQALAALFTEPVPPGAARRCASPSFGRGAGRRSSPGGSRPLQGSDGAVEGRRLAGLWGGDGSAANGSRTIQ